MRFEFATATRIVFGPGTLADVPAAARDLGRRAFVVADSVDRSAALLDALRTAGIEPFPHPVSAEPDVESIQAGLEAARRADCDLVIGMGGGSALDTGKAVAALLNNPGELTDYLEVIGKGKPLTQPGRPYVAIPTTAGTGSEVTRNAVIAVPQPCLKVSLRSPHLLPRLAVVDPELTYSLPPALTASTGLDALTQLIEPFVSNAATPLTDALCREGLRRAARSLRRAYENGGDAAAREDMSLASLFGGLALANARLGAVHGLATPIGGTYQAPHGAVCARLLPEVMELNIKTLKKHSRNSPALDRYAEIAHLFTGNALATAEDGSRWVGRLIRTLEVRPLGEFGLKPADFPEIVTQAQKASSMKGNPVELSDEQLLLILKKAT